MHWATRLLAAGLAVTVGQAAHASGVGAAFYQPAKVVRPVGYQAPATCQAPCTGCASCQRLGFACVDHATPAPCAAEGCCVPRRATFGHYTNNWRRWPGDVDDEGPTPEEAAAEDPLLAPFDAPEPTKEDIQAPPPIEDDSEAQREAAEEESQFELNLPPIPEVRPEQGRPRPAPIEPNDPPALPFGSVMPRLPEFVEPRQDLPPTTPQPVIRPVVHMQSRDDAPPPLPSSFSSKTVSLPTRLPEVYAPTHGLVDAGVRQVSHLSEE